MLYFIYEINNDRKESHMETIEISRTVKSRIVFLNPNDIPKMVASQEAFRQACNFVSHYMFHNGFI